MTPEISLHYVHGAALGYGRLGVKLAAALARAGIDVYDLETPDQETGDASRRFKHTNVTCWVSVPSHARAWYSGQVPVLFTMWEAEQLPEGFREHLAEFDTLVVPSDHNVELFGRYHPRVRRVLLGVDTDEWTFTARREPGVFFTFLCAGSGRRKGTDLAAAAFHRAFPDGSWGDGPVPRLVMKNPRGEDFRGERIEVVSGRISAEAERALYADAHCYVGPSRGEGFGLQPLQAMAQGCPTILTAAHGHAAFAHLGIGISATKSPSDYFIYGDAGQWWEPSLDELTDAMRWVYDNYDAASADAADAADEVARSFSWDRTAEQFTHAIGPERLCEPYRGDGSRYVPDQRLFLVRVNKPWRADIAGRERQFWPGEDSYEPADVKRILFEAGLLDPSCLQHVLEGDGGFHADVGLTPEQVQRIGAYTADHAYCHACVQVLNSRPTRADDLYAGLVR